jgi:dihydroorotase-like cyclic amidohydrolase
MSKIRLKILQEEVKILESRLEPHDTGHLRTTIGVLNGRIKEIGEQLEKDAKAIIVDYDELSLGMC